MASDNTASKSLDICLSIDIEYSSSWEFTVSILTKDVDNSPILSTISSSEESTLSADCTSSEKSKML